MPDIRRNDKTELVVAIERNDLQKVARIVNANFDLTCEISEDHTAIQYARNLNRWDCVKVIAKLRPTNFQDKAKYSDVMLTAVRRNNLDAAKCLLYAGASSSWYTNDDKNFCLHHAVINKNPKMIALLLIYLGNSIAEEKNNDNQTPIDLAKRLGVTKLFFEGWGLYEDYSCIALIIMLQGYRQEGNIFQMLSFEILNHIAMYLSEFHPPIDMIKHSMLKIAARKFKNYDCPRLFKLFPNPNQRLQQELNQILKHPEGKQKVEKSIQGEQLEKAVNQLVDKLRTKKYKWGATNIVVDQLINHGLIFGKVYLQEDRENKKDKNAKYVFKK